MKKLNKIERTDYEIESITCDKCGFKMTDNLDTQEAVCFKIRGGFNAAFGDGIVLEYDLCSKCHYEMVKDFCRLKETWGV